jgi:hemerythrin-like domain-containing protein
MKITEALTVEHAAFRALVEQIERACPQVKSLHEVRLLAQLMDRLLSQHQSKEANTLYVAYDHMLEDRGQLGRLSREHDRLDQQLLNVQRAKTLKEAKCLLRAALSRIKDHFRFEEVKVFPAIEQTLQRETLETLSEAI